VVRELSNNRAGLHKELGFLLITLLLSGCSTIGMTKVDKEYQDAGYILHCTEVAGDTCLTRQWFKEKQTTYERFHNDQEKEAGSTEAGEDSSTTE